MTRKTLVTAGWLAMTSAVLTIPWFILTFFLAEQKGVAAKAAEAAGDVLPDQRLSNTIAKRRAQRYLSNKYWQEDCAFEG